MRHRAPRSTGLLKVSNRIYRALLILYPRGFRTDYGPHIAQVFRDCCRQADHESGSRGVVWLWLSAVRDLAVSAPRERMTAVNTSGKQIAQALHPSRSRMIRVAGGATAVGVAVYLLSSVPASAGSGTSCWCGICVNHAAKSK